MKEENTSLLDYLEHLQSQGQYWFLRDQARDALQLTENAFQKAAHRLIKKGKLDRVKGQFYMIVPPEYQATRSLPASWFIDALMAYCQQKYYVGALTASAFQGAAHQQPMTFQVISDKPTRSITLGQVHIEFLYKKKILPHFSQAIKTASGTMQVSTPEMTAFDLVRYINAAGQINQVATVLSELTNKINPDHLVHLLANKEVEISTAQRLGYLIEQVTQDVDLHAFKTQLKRRKTTYRLLVSGGSSTIIAQNKDWHILVNEKLELDEL